jgi:hypothetical protein
MAQTAGVSPLTLTVPPTAKSPIPRATAQTLIDQLTARGVRFSVDAGLVRWQAPHGAMTVADLREIKAQEPALRALLGDTTQEAG